jgi:hypothetical protein
MKKILFNYTRESLNIPPLFLHLKNKRIPFPIYLKSLVG